MLKGNYTFIRATRNEGIGKTSGKPFDIGTLTLSDGLESFDMDIKPVLVPTLAHITKGDSIEVEVEVQTGFRGTSYQVAAVKVLQTK